ncbi:MAG: acyl-CoA ligase (AMP-forming), exosortase A system-associated [Xylophilus ampelinus]
MTPPVALLHDLPAHAARRDPSAPAVGDGTAALDYAGLWAEARRVAAGLRGLGIGRGDRVAVFLEKRVEAVAAGFGITAAGAVLVPVNPQLRPAQVAHILRDCGVRLLLTSEPRRAALGTALADCPALRHLLLVPAPDPAAPPPEAAGGPARTAWADLPPAPEELEGAWLHGVTDADMAAIFYTSGSTGLPKGVVLSHRNLVAGAQSVAGYLDNRPDDVLLAVLPLSFDAGFSQLTTACVAGARVALLNHLLPRDVLRALERERVTGLTAVPPLYIQLARLDWPAGVAERLRYFANTGGHLPRPTLQALRARLPRSRPFLMYGLTEAFRSTYLPPEEIDRRPDSIGRAIPNAEVLVLRPDGTPCAADEPGELVHRGPLVSLGYWGDAERTAARFRPLPAGLEARPAGLTLAERAVFSGDTVRRDADGFLYFIGRGDEMIKTSGYRVSPTEVEDALYASGLVAECAVCGVPDPDLGQAIHAVVAPVGGADAAALQAECRRRLPAYMVPRSFDLRPGGLPRGANGKIDRPALVPARPAGAAATSEAAAAPQEGVPPCAVPPAASC